MYDAGCLLPRVPAAADPRSPRPAPSAAASASGTTIWSAAPLLNENKNPTLMVGINGFFGARAMEFGYAFAGIILVSLPMIILFLCLQKYFIKGIAAGAVKG